MEVDSKQKLYKLPYDESERIINLMIAQEAVDSPMELEKGNYKFTLVVSMSLYYFAMWSTMMS